jgi:aryl-alcohol dehydrogenase-like predicted oxidoreductase
MRTRPLGTSGIDASVIALGAYPMGGWMWGGTGGSDESDAIRAVHAAIDNGVTFIDTAPLYGFGAAEEFIGRALKGRRDQVVLATKCGLRWDRTEGEFFVKTDPDKVVGEGETEIYRYLGPDGIREEIERSLSRLQVETIDLYQTHWQDKTTPIADTMGELMRLKEEGKIRAIGCSNATTAQMDEYRSAGDLDCDQELYSMLDRKHETENLPYCEKHTLAFLAYSPLGQGLLTGKVTPEREFGEGDMRRHKDRFSVENRKTVLAMLEAYRGVAEKHDLTFAQLAIAWTAHQPGCSHVLVGARDETQATENARAGDVTLSEEDLGTIRDAIDQYASKIS